MLMRSWIRHLFTRRVTRPIRKLPHRTRLVMEEMEARWLPSIVVNNPTDLPIGGETNLRQAIIQANTIGGDETIVFNSTVFATPRTITLSGSQLELSDTTGTETITGPAAGVTISGGGLSRVFQVDSGVVAVLSGLKIKGGYASNGGGVANYYGSLTMTDCTVSGNNASGSGGGVYSYGYGSSLTLNNCNVSGNTAYNEGGGVFQKYGTLTLTNCTISGNTATTSSGGGIFQTYSTATLTNCTISGNNASGSGGGLYSYGYGSTVAMTNCTISGNKATASGGGVFQKYGTLTLTNCNINGGYAYNGGGLANYSGSLTLTNCTVSGNIATHKGGGLYSSGYSGSLTLTNCSISGNTAYYEGGGVFQKYGTATLTNCTISGNRAYSGGGLANYSGSLSMSNSTVSDNTIFYGIGGGSVYGSGGGGGMFSSGSSSALSMVNCTISGNSARYAAGGGMDIVVGNSATLNYCTISGNYSYYGGGGVYTSGSGNALTLTNCTVSGNTSNWTGGGVYTFGSNSALTLTNCTVSGNSASGSGGGVANLGLAAATLTNSTVYFNTADADYGFKGGGGVYNGSKSTAILTNCTVSGNATEGAGGGVYNDKAFGEMTLGNTIVANNTAAINGLDAQGNIDSQGNNLIGKDNGSTGWVSSDLTGTSSKPLMPLLAPLGFYGGPTETVALMPDSPAIGAGQTQPGTTDQRGLNRPNGPSDIGAFQSGPLVVTTTADSDSFGTLTLRDAVAIANTDMVAGTSEPITFDPTMFATPQTITLNGTQLELSDTNVAETITGPAASVTISGGGLSRVFQVDSGVVATLSGLTITGGSDSNGGGVNNSGALTLANCTVSGNIASNDGGGVNNYSGSLTLTNSTVSGNIASNDGGGVFQHYGALTLTNSTISGNTSKDGGGVSLKYGTLTLTNSTISGNSSNNGGGVSNYSGSLTLTDSTVSGNNASNNGGGVYMSGYDSTLALTSCTVSGNTASDNGGGVYMSGSDCSLSLTNCTISANTASRGGGVYMSGSGSLFELTNSTVNGNNASDEGGGVFQEYGTLTLTNSTISGNSSNNGGGVNSYSGTFTLTNCALSGNTALNGGGIDVSGNASGNISTSTFVGNSSLNGGGIYNTENGKLTTTNNTFFENTASVNGGGIYNSGSLMASNSTFFENSADSGGGLYTQGSSLLNGDILVGSPGSGDIAGSKVSTGSSHNLVGTDLSDSLANGVNGNQVGITVAQAGLAPPSSNGGLTETCAVLPGSFALGKGLTSTTLQYDQRGVARPVGEPGDVGAFQLSASPNITTEPISEIVTANENASFSAAASDFYTDGSSVATTVQWQISTNGGRTFIPIAIGGVYGNSVTTDNLAITGATESMNGDEYESVFTNPAGQTAKTSVVTLTVDYVSTNPSNVALIVGQTAVFTAGTSNPLGTDSVQWQVNTNNGNGFTNISGATSTTLTVSNTTATENGYEYRAVFSSTSYSGTLTTSPATLNVDFMTASPSNMTLNAGQTAVFTAGISNPLGTDSVQWQVNANNGNGFTNIGGATSTTLTISNTTATENGYEYRAVFSNTAYSSSLTTSPATLAVDHLTANPTNVTLNASQTAVFTAGTSNPLGTDSVQWQVNTNNGNGFTNISGATSTTLTISNTSAAENGYEYRAVFSNTAYSGSLTTSPATVTVDYVTANPINVTLNVGQMATFTAGSSNPMGTDRVQWQVNANNGSGFTNIGGATSTTLTISNTTAAENGYEYQAVFSNTAYSGSLTTNPVTLAVDHVTANPINVTLNASQTATFTAGTSNPLGTDSVQWQINANNGSGFTNIGGATSTTLTISNTSAVENGFEYRAVFSNTAYSGSLTTSPATLAVDHVTANPINVTLIVGQTATYTTASSNPLGTDNVQWQVNANNGSGFTNIGGATSTTLTISNTTAAENGYEYRAVFSNTAYSGSLTTNPATLTVDSVTENPINVTLNAGQTAVFTAGTSNPLNTDSVQWQVNANNGSGFTNISGATSTTLTISNTTAAENGYEYQAVFSNTAYSGTLTTNPATLTVEYAPIVITNPKNFSIEAGYNTSLTATAVGNPTPTVQWQVSTNDGSTFTNVSDGGVYSGALTDTLNITGAATSMNGYEYRAAFSNTLIGASSPSTATSSVANGFIYISPDPHTSTVSVSSNSVQSGSSVTVTLQAKDSNGIDIPSGAPAVSFSLTSITEGKGIFGPVTNNGNGTYTTTFTGTVAGIADITATLDGQTITSSLPSITVTPGAVSLAKSTLTVSSGSVQSGSEVVVSLQAEDANGNDLPTQGLNVVFATGSVTGGQGTFGSVTVSGNGTYSATFLGTLTGNNTITATINGQQITSTAPAITVTPGPVDLANSVVVLGAPSIQLGGTTTITLQAKDALGNDETSGGLNVKLALGSTASAIGTLSSVADNNNGTYTATFTGKTAGSNTIAATINGVPVTSAAPSITVTGAAVSVAKSTVKLSPSSVVQSGNTTTITLQAEDAKGNKETSGGLIVSFKLGSTKGGRGTFGPVTDNGNGTYTVNFTGTIAGSNTIVATIDGHTVTSSAPTIKVPPGPVSLANSLVTLSVASIKPGGITKVTLQAKDAMGNKETTGGLNVLFLLASPTGGQGTFSSVTDNHNGTYTVTFKGTGVGSNTIEATIDSSPVTSKAPTIKVT